MDQKEHPNKENKESGHTESPKHKVVCRPKIDNTAKQEMEEMIKQIHKKEPHHTGARANVNREIDPKEHIHKLDGERVHPHPGMLGEDQVIIDVDASSYIDLTTEEDEDPQWTNLHEQGEIISNISTPHMVERTSDC